MRVSVIVPFHHGEEHLAKCLAALARASRRLPVPAEVIVVADGAPRDPSPVTEAAGATLLRLSGPNGPATARNRGAAAAAGDLLMFVDSDTEVHADALQRLRRVIEEEGVDAVFGAYDDAPADRGFVSQARNLAHSHVHQQSDRRAVTFWAGLGGVRAPAFAQVGGFDERFRRPSVEDIDLGYRLTAAGRTIVLDPQIRATHLKRWSAGSGLITDIRDRGVPWTQLIYRYGQLRRDLNLTVRARACVALMALAPLAPALAWRSPVAWLIALAAIAAVAGLDAPHLTFLQQRRGAWFAVRALPLRWLHYSASAVAAAAGTAIYAADRLLGIRLPGALPAEPWTRPSAPSAL